MLNIIKTNLQFNSNISKMGAIEGVALHHNGVSSPQSVEVIHNYHKNHNGWAGIGYHWFVRRDGKIYEGRLEKYAGAHCPSINSTSIGICAEGNFNEEIMPEVQKQAIIELIADIKERYNIKWIKGHKEIINTSCPGANFPLNEIRNTICIMNETVKKNEYIANIAREVISGKYGVGEERKRALGSLYNEVQTKVNEILIGKNVVPKKCNEQIADEVIVGKWGNGKDRKTRLTSAGYDYDTIQNIVNKKLR